MPSPFQTRNIARSQAKYTTVKIITADTTLTDADTGKSIGVDANGGTRTITLPSAKDGHNFHIWVYKGTNNVTVNTAATTSLFKGGLVCLDTDNEVNVQTAANESNDDSMLLDSANLGTSIHLVSDGTHWYVSGHVVTDDPQTIFS